MVARLGNVLYWVGSGIACLLLLVVVAALLFGTASERFIEVVPAIVASVLVWLIARACRYVLAGR
jgi:predicted membrane protein